MIPPYRKAARLLSGSNAEFAIQPQIHSGITVFSETTSVHNVFGWIVLFVFACLCGTAPFWDGFRHFRLTFLAAFLLVCSALCGVYSIARIFLVLSRKKQMTIAENNIATITETWPRKFTSSVSIDKLNIDVCPVILTTGVAPWTGFYLFAWHDDSWIALAAVEESPHSLEDYVVQYFGADFRRRISHGLPVVCRSEIFS